MARFSRSSRSADGRRNGFAVVVLAVALLPVLEPLLSTDLTCGYDNVFHLYRAVQIDRLWTDGILYSRWAPDMALGYGFPLFVFTSFFPAALVAVFHRMGTAWPVALNAVFGLGVVLGGLFTYLLGRDLFGRTPDRRTNLAHGAGLVAAIAYVYAPFQAYDVLFRGSLWESFAWAFPPLVLLGVQRYAVDGERRFLTIGVGALAAMILSHHLFAFLFAPVFGLWVLTFALVRRDWGILGRGATLGALGLGVTAFFWLPALAERSLVQTERLLGSWVFDYRYNFLQLGHLAALPRRADPALVNDWPVKALGLVPLVVGAVPFGGWRRASRERRAVVVVLWVLVLGTSWLALPESIWVWDHAPLLEYVQFPWRYLGPAAFCLSLLAGAAAQTMVEISAERAPRLGDGAIALFALALMLAALGWLYPRHCSAPGDLTVSGMIGWERATDTLGTTAKGEYLPVWVERMPPEPLGSVGPNGAYQAGPPVERLRAMDLPEGGRLLDADYGAQSATIVLETPSAFQARYLAFYYPGWHVAIDGKPVPVTPEERTGFLTFPVPQGRHTVDIGFGETRLRVGADLISAVTLVVGIVLAVVGPGRHVVRPQPNDGAVWRGAVPALGVALAVIAAKPIVDRYGLLWRSSRLAEDGTLATLPASEYANFGGRAQLLGLTPLPGGFRADESPLLTLYWRALDPGSAEWRVGLALVGADGSRFNAGLRPARWSREPGPLWEWPSASYARMDYEVDVPVGLPPGAYGVELSLFDRGTGVPASVLDSAGNPLGPTLAIAPVVVRRPDEAASLGALGVRADAQLMPCGAVGLWTVSLDRDAAAPGDALAVRMVWEALTAPATDLEAVLTLLDQRSVVQQNWSVDLVAPWWQTSNWRTGDRWVGRAQVRLPGGLETGTYSIVLSAEDCTFVLQSLKVVAPDRLWQVPQAFTPTDAVLGGVVRLAGTSPIPGVTPAGEPLVIELAWEGLAEMTTSYRVFVHLVDAGGRILAQSDGEPVGWTRPTTGWSVGEVVVDRRTLEVPPGTSADAELRVGMYDPTGQRLVGVSGADFAVLGLVKIR
ncbi:MAG: YfhO family protein [Anaerolineae bacterium]|nr:YfhO family protein [Anaerolineae bacterium]